MNLQPRNTEIIMPPPLVMPGDPEFGRVGGTGVRRGAQRGIANRWGGGEFSPTDITGCFLWFDAADAATITESSGAVSQWDDKSGEGNDATQSTGSLQPTTGTRTQNSLNVIDAANDEMDLPDLSSYISGSDSRTIFVAGASDTDSGSFISFGPNNTGERWTFRVRTSGVLRVEIQGSGYDTALSGKTFGGFVAHQDGTQLQDITAYLNGGSGEAFSGTNTINTDTTTGNYLFHAIFPVTGNYDGVIGEVIAYDSALSASNMNLVGNYLADKWGFTWTDIT